jgi:hypothetical protein
VFVVVEEVHTRRQSVAVLHQTMEQHQQLLPLLHVRRRWFPEHKPPPMSEVEVHNRKCLSFVEILSRETRRWISGRQKFVVYKRGKIERFQKHQKDLIEENELRFRYREDIRQ